MAAPKATTSQQSAAIDRRINELSLRGATQPAIARELGITKQAVSRRVKKLNARTVAERAAYIAQEVRILDWSQREAMDAWERSKQDAERVTVEQRDGKGRATKTTEGQSGDAAHLGNVVRASESRRKLLGLDATARDVSLGFTPDQLAGMTDDELIDLIAKLDTAAQSR